MGAQRAITLILLSALVVLGVWLAVSNSDLFGFGSDDARDESKPLQNVADRRQGQREADPSAATGQRESLIQEDGADTTFRQALSGFRGRVLASDGKPTPQKRVVFYRVDGQMMPATGLFAAAGDLEMRFPQKETTTDYLGRFVITGFWPRAIYVIDIDPDGEQRTWKILDKSPGPGEIIDLGDFHLQQLGTIVGQILNQDGEPVSGAWVHAINFASVMDALPVERFHPDGALIVRSTIPPAVVRFPKWVMNWIHRMPFLRATQSAADGRFELTAVQPGSNRVLINDPGLEPIARNAVRVRAGRKKNLGRIVLRQGEELLGRVVDSSGKPVVGAEVLAGSTMPFVQTELAVPVGQTDAEGRFSAFGFSNSDVVVSVRRDKGDAWSVHGPAPIAEEVSIQLPVLHNLTVQLRSAAGKPISAPRFKLLQSNMGSKGLLFGGLGFLPWVDLQGRVENLGDGRYRLTRLAPGDYALAATAAGHGTRRIPFHVPTTGNLSVLLPSSTSLEVLAQDANQRPVSRAAVYMDLLSQDGPGDRAAPMFVGRTDRKGFLKIANAVAGNVRVAALHPAHGTVETGVNLPRQGPVVLRFHTPGWLKGRLTEGGRPARLGKWTIILSPKQQEGEAQPVMAPLPRFASADSKGSFQFRSLNPGRYTVRAIDSLAAMSEPGGAGKILNPYAYLGVDSSREVLILSGRETFVELAAEGADDPAGRGQIAGTVTLNGAPGKGLLLLCHDGRTPHQAKLKEDGRFQLTGIRPGKHGVGVFHKGGAGELQVIGFTGDITLLWNKNVEVAAGVTTRLNIDVQSGRAKGRVLTAAGKPAAQVRVVLMVSARAREQGHAGYAQATTDRQGNFVFEVLRAGDYELQVEDRRFGAGELKQLSVPDGVTTQFPVLRLEPTFTVQGRIDMAALGGFKVTSIDISFATKGQKTTRLKSARVDLRTGRFKVDGLHAGKYEITLASNPELFKGKEMVCQHKLELRDKNIRDLVVRPIWRKPEFDEEEPIENAFDEPPKKGKAKRAKKKD